MSHITKVRIQMTDVAAINAAAAHLGLKCLGEQRHELYGNQKAYGLGFALPGWEYPLVIDVGTGEAVYDNFNGQWGKQIELDKLAQRYGVEAAKLYAEQNNYMFSETELANGDVEVELVDMMS